ncbi:MAG: redoxin family protein [Planctomycetaceae bacterium]|nr:redoxin family protein [Planctomycetaceae bacterium]
MTFRFSMVAMLACCLFGAGCSNEPAPAPNDTEVPGAGGAVSPELGEPELAPPGQSEEPEPAEPKGKEESEVSLQIMEWEAARALVDKHKGKIVVMDLWATYCPPCLEELPNLVKLHQEHGDDVACISVSLDYQGFDDEPVESFREKVLGVLQKLNASCENVLLSTDSETMFQQKIDQASIPVVYVFGRDGEKVATFPDPNDPGEFTYAGQILPVVEKLMKQP